MVNLDDLALIITILTKKWESLKNRFSDDLTSLSKMIFSSEKVISKFEFFFARNSILGTDDLICSC